MPETKNRMLRQWDKKVTKSFVRRCFRYPGAMPKNEAAPIGTDQNAKQPLP